MDQHNEYKALVDNLNTAHTSSQRALDALYSPSGPKRSIWYRMRLGRAQNALISLYVRELARQHEKEE